MNLEYLYALLIAAALISALASKQNFTLFLKTTGVFLLVFLSVSYNILWQMNALPGPYFQIIPAGLVCLSISSLFGWLLTSTSFRPEWLQD